MQTGCLCATEQRDPTRIASPGAVGKTKGLAPTVHLLAQAKSPVLKPLNSLKIVLYPVPLFLPPIHRKTASPPTGGSWKASQEAGHQEDLSYQSSEAAKLVGISSYSTLLPALTGWL